MARRVMCGFVTVSRWKADTHTVPAVCSHTVHTVDYHEQVLKHSREVPWLNLLRRHDQKKLESNAA